MICTTTNMAIFSAFHCSVGSHEPPTPSMFSPSFANAMESAAAASTMEGAAAAAAAAAVAGMSSPSIFYNAASPYTPGHAHHHSFSMPGTTQQRQNTGLFDTGAPAGSFAREISDTGHAHGSSGAAIPHSIGPAASFRTNTSASSGGIGADDDYSMGLQITMNAAMAAAMSGSFDENSHNRNSSTASAFSRVQIPGNVPQMIGNNNIGTGQTPTGLGLDISTTFASFANIPGFDAFPSAPLDRQHNFSQGLAHNDCAGASYGILSSEPALLGSMDPAASLHTAVSHSRFISAAGSSFVSSASPSNSAMENPITSPVAGGSHGSVCSPAPAGTKKSRKRAATVSTIRAEAHQQPQPQLQLQQQQRKMHQPAALVSMSIQGSANGSALPCLSSESVSYTGPVFNSQAIVKGSGSKVIMVLTSKVAQKSYGTEKRFLCPPPTILLFGDNWKLPVMADQQAAHNGDFAAAMPRISVSVPTNDGPGMLADMSDVMSGSSSDSRISQLEWLAQPDPSPKPKAHVPHNPVPPVRAPQEGDTITGRYVAKQLFINDVDEKRKKVAVKVRLHDPSGQIVINEFESRPIKVISKPSKKRQSVKNVDLCIHHGSTISLFNRLRSQTVSTKYLGATRSMSVGGPRPFWFPARDSDDSVSNGASVNGSSNTTTFVARNSVWDPFIIWIVNTHLGQKEIDAFNERIAANPTPIPGYPTPPTFAMHPQCPPDFDSCVPNGGGCNSPGEPGDQIQIDTDSMGQPQPRAPIPILYNQPVILQCVSTGMCSPVLTLRKVEKGSMAVGSFYGRDSSRDVLGDPVSQLHKVAFEVRVQTREELPAVTVTPAGLNTRVGSYLTCMGDIVGLNATCDGRQLATDNQAGNKPRGSPGQGRKQAKDGASVGTTSWTEDVGDNAVWTMVGTDCTIYRFDYPLATDIVSQLQQATAASNTLPATPSATESSSMASSHASLALPPTPTSPSGVKEYGHHGSQAQFSLEMMLAEHGSAAVAAAVSGIGSSEFQHGAIDPSIAAAVYGIPMPIVGGGLPGHHHGPGNHRMLSASQALPLGASTSADDQVCVGGMENNNGNNGGLTGLSRNGQQSVGEYMNSSSVSSDCMVPIVFKCSIQHPPTVNPSALDGRRRQRDGANVQSTTERSYVSLHGINFTPDMVVLFDGQKSLITELKSSESIVCLGPLPSDFSGPNHRTGTETKPLQHPTSPSASDASSSHAHSSDDVQQLAPMHGGLLQTNRASSAESTASTSSTANSSGTIGGCVAESDASRGTGKGAAVTKIPIYLSRNGGAGPTFKTGQFYTMHF
ncbi:hypothetical protein GGF40_000110 [Coemansia sp. RSA 1286]|nr:hypothetical protein GGF40_000110 [Coemansia sp. RSA 1286]